MYTIKTTMLFALLLGFTQIQAQNVNIIKLGGSLLGLSSDGESETYLGGGLSIEHQINTKSSLVLNANLNTKEESLSDGVNKYSFRLNVTTIEPEFRYYPKAATDGFYVGGAVALHLLNYKITGAVTGDDSDTEFGAGLTTGYQFLLAKSLHLQIGGGAGLIFPKEDTDAIFRYNFNLMLGYQF